MKKETKAVLAADRLRVAISGRGTHRFLSAAAAQGIKLQAVRCEGDGYSAGIAGADLGRLRRLADSGHWQLNLVRRKGPGRWLERLLGRPGLVVGLLLFFVLVRWLSGYVWHIDFGELEAQRRNTFRAVLEEQGIREGTRMTQELLHSAQYALLQQSADFGWLSLNFAGGCLFVEQTENQTQTIQIPDGDVALYAKADGQILALRLQSGFAQVNAGQYVAEGQLLANGQKADRNGDAVMQGASGQIVARVQKTYAASQPLALQAEIPTGQSMRRDTWYFLGVPVISPQEEQSPYENQVQTVEWLPLAFGRIALPGCICRETCWETRTAELTYSTADAEALAYRQCRLALAEEFPDAVVESESRTASYTDTGVRCEVRFVFTADIARQGPLTPLPDTQAGT